MIELAHDPHKTVTALGEIFNGEKSIPATITGGYREHSFDPVECTVVPHQHFDRSEYWQEEDRRQFLQLKGKTSSGKGIWIPRFLIVEDWGDHLGGTAELFAEGMRSEGWKKANLIV
jgi:hypothetical protein